MEWFRSIDKNNSGSIDAMELKLILSKGNMACNDECAHKLLRMFDKDASGHIGFNEFLELHKYMSSMRQGFDSVDKDKSGFLDQGEIFQALSACGYQLSKPTFDLIFQHFDRKKQYKLAFDDYIELCIFLGTSRSVFQMYDAQKTGYVNMSLDSFLAASVRIYP